MPEQLVERGYQEMSEPIDFGCPRIEVSTDDGYEPAFVDIVAAAEAAYRAGDHPL